MDIEIRELTKKYDSKSVFERFSVTYKSGKVTALMGKSGVGKTTLLNCIAKTLPFDGGSIGGANDVSFVFQEDRLIPHLNVYDNLDFICKDKKMKDGIVGVLKDVDMLDKIKSFPSELSGGQKKRVALARAFLSESKLMLLDEPMNSLDFGLKLKMYRLFLNLIKESGKTAIYVTHDIDEALSVADEISVISNSEEVYRYAFLSDKNERNISNEECVGVRRKLMNLLS
ncbi:MAG: ATP-binding cassette domain-containing protein [Clostridia bacterium]|nr:ATP-binding cassette domain-containing protein [Clostridia bacterium]